MTRKSKSSSRLFREITLKKGSTIGEHVHVNDSKYYWITEGDGIVTKRDLVVTGDGASHAIRNEQDAPLKFVAIIIDERAGKQTTARAAWNFQAALAFVYKYISF